MEDTKKLNLPKGYLVEDQYGTPYDPAEHVKMLHDATGSYTFFPEREQETWFRCVYPKGRLECRVVAASDETYRARAAVYADIADVNPLAVAEAVRTTKQLPNGGVVDGCGWAQTAAKGVALRNAGFGCQFDFSGDEPTGMTYDAVNELDALMGEGTKNALAGMSAPKSEKSEKKTKKTAAKELPEPAAPTEAPEEGTAESKPAGLDPSLADRNHFFGEPLKDALEKAGAVTCPLKGETHGLPLAQILKNDAETGTQTGRHALEYLARNAATDKATEVNLAAEFLLKVAYKIA